MGTPYNGIFPQLQILWMPSDFLRSYSNHFLVVYLGHLYLFWTLGIGQVLQLYKKKKLIIWEIFGSPHRNPLLISMLNLLTHIRWIHQAGSCINVLNVHFQDMNQMFKYGYVSHKNQRGLYKLDLANMRYIRSIDLAPYNCVPHSIQFSALCKCKLIIKRIF